MCPPLLLLVWQRTHKYLLNNFLKGDNFLRHSGNLPENENLCKFLSLDPTA